MPQSPKGYVNAYSSVQRETETGRAADARALLSCASKLEAAKSPECSYNDYAEAIKLNLRLWTVFQVSVTDQTNPLPHEIKVNIFKLSRFVDKASFAAIAKRNPDTLQSLININRELAAGLRMQPPQQAVQQQPTAAPTDYLPQSITT